MTPIPDPIERALAVLRVLGAALTVLLTLALVGAGGCMLITKVDACEHRMQARCELLHTARAAEFIRRLHPDWVNPHIQCRGCGNCNIAADGRGAEVLTCDKHGCEIRVPYR